MYTFLKDTTSLFNVFYRFSVTAIKISAELHVEIGKLIPTFIWQCKGPRVKKNKTKLKMLNYLILKVTIKL